MGSGSDVALIIQMTYLMKFMLPVGAIAFLIAFRTLYFTKLNHPQHRIIYAWIIFAVAFSMIAQLYFSRHSDMAFYLSKWESIPAFMPMWAKRLWAGITRYFICVINLDVLFVGITLLSASSPRSDIGSDNARPSSSLRAHLMISVAPYLVIPPILYFIASSTLRSTHDGLARLAYSAAVLTIAPKAIAAILLIIRFLQYRDLNGPARWLRSIMIFLVLLWAYRYSYTLLGAVPGRMALASSTANRITAVSLWLMLPTLFVDILILNFLFVHSRVSNNRLSNSHAAVCGA